MDSARSIPRFELTAAESTAGVGVVTFHDLFVMTGDYSTTEFRARFTEQAREAAAAADHIIAVSAFTASQVHDLLGVETQRITVTHHGVRFREFPARSREQLVLCVGALQKRKNMVRLVHAFRAVPVGWRLVLAGSEDMNREKLRAIDESPRREDIIRTGWISDAALADYYARASIFAFPSLDEGFGIPVLEAMMAGLPVLTSNRSALPEVAGDAALLVDPMQEEEMASGLKRLASDEGLRADLVVRGYERVKQFRWDRTVTQTITVYRDNLSASRRTPKSDQLPSSSTEILRAFRNFASCESPSEYVPRPGSSVHRQRLPLPLRNLHVC